MHIESPIDYKMGPGIHQFLDLYRKLWEIMINQEK